VQSDRTDGRFAVGFVPGVTVTKWTRAWSERQPAVPLDLVRTTESDQVAVLLDGTADVCFVRLPIDPAGLNVIPLYREVAVVVAPRDHAIAAADSVTLADLAGEPLQPDPTAFDLVAAGVGILILPHSIARLQSRKDLVSRPVTDAPQTQVALAWLGDPGDGLAARIEEFVGIVRGRTARSSRTQTEADAPERKPDEKPAKRPAKAKAATNAKKSTPTRAGSYGQQRKAAAARKKHRGR
jgi:DNA-binding transcriptional LysR family regulator